MPREYLPYRHSIRLKNYDYSNPGYYFVTICTQDREYLFGNVVDHNMVLNAAGNMIWNVWQEIPEYYENINIDIFQIMPNHIHGIVRINNVGAGPCARPSSNPFNSCHVFQNGRAQGPAPTIDLPKIIRDFKSLTTKGYIDGIKNHNWRSFNRRLWQRNYYEHIIRSEEKLRQLRQYIQNNPINWRRDSLFFRIQN